MNKEVTQNYIALLRKKKQLETILDNTKKDIEMTEKFMIDDMMNDSVSSFKTESDETVYIQRSVFFGVSDRYSWQDVNEYLEDYGMGDIVQTRPNAQTLRSAMNEKITEAEEEGQEFHLPECLKMTEKFSVRVRGL